MISMLDIAKQDGESLAKRAIVSRVKDKNGKPIKSDGEIIEHFTRRRFRSLYRDHILRTRGRNPSDREADLALQQALDDV